MQTDCLPPATTSPFHLSTTPSSLINTRNTLHYIYDGYSISCTNFHLLFHPGFHVDMDQIPDTPHPTPQNRCLEDQECPKKAFDSVLILYNPAPKKKKRNC